MSAVVVAVTVTPRTAEAAAATVVVEEMEAAAAEVIMANKSIEELHAEIRKLRDEQLQILTYAGWFLVAYVAAGAILLGLAIWYQP